MKKKLTHQIRGLGMQYREKISIGCVMKGGYMKVAHLADAIILQAIDDLWDEEQRQGCIEFFTGEDFRTCAAIAGISTSDQIKILKMFGGIMKGAGKSVTTGKKTDFGYAAPVSELRRELAGSR
jgi:hypothetical protein